MFSVLTGQLVRTISAASATAHKGLVSQIRMNPKNRYQLFSASLDGTIKLWDINDGSLIKTWNLHQPITHFALNPEDPRSAYVAVLRSPVPRVKDGKSKATRGKGQVAHVRLTLGTKKNSPKLVTMLKIKDCAGLDVTSEVLVIASSTRFEVIILEDGTTFGLASVTRFFPKEKISSISIHPTDPCVAVGLANGEINLWYCISAPGNPHPVVSKLHWHAHSVSDLRFTPDGVYLLSGGEEAVLVIWQLATQHKQFLPRLGADIQSIGMSEDQSLYAITLGDNTVKIVSATDLSIRQAVSGLKAASNAGRQTSDDLDLAAGGREVLWRSPLRYRNSGITIDPRSNLVALVSGGGASIQFFNAQEDRHVMEIETSPRNRVSRTEAEEMSHNELTKIAFSALGNWMATVDVSPSSDGQLDQSVKIWEFDTVQQSYVVNTRISSPHDDLITSICFAPTTDSSENDPQLLLTASLDSKFKTWQLHNATTASLPSLTPTTPSKATTTTPEAFDAFWSPRSVGTHRSFPIHDAAFSADGSVVALATGAVVTLWDPFTAILKAMLSYPPTTDPVLSVGFTGGNFGANPVKNAAACRIPFLTAMTASRVHVWNLLTCTVWWSYALDGGVPACLKVDPETECFAIAVVRKVERDADVSEKGKDAMEETEGGEKGTVVSASKSNFSYFTDVMVFEPTSPAPRTCHRLDGIVRGLNFLPGPASPKNASPSDRTLVMTDLFELQVMGNWNGLNQPRKAEKIVSDNSNENSLLKSQSSVATPATEEVKTGLLSSVYGSAAALEPAPTPKVTGKTIGEEASALVDRKTREGSALAFWDGPTYLLPESSLFAATILESMLPRRNDKGVVAGKPTVIWRDNGSDEVVDGMDVEEIETVKAKNMSSMCLGEDEEGDIGELGGLTEILKGIDLCGEVALKPGVNGTSAAKKSVNGGSAHEETAGGVANGSASLKKKKKKQTDA
ncbi:WD repeat-containing protein 75 [Dinochytrium kinnereticum]|nr:WD repeat-containing protein 75 [Dinochytrium kinnereticum]